MVIEDNTARFVVERLCRKYKFRPVKKQSPVSYEVVGRMGKVHVSVRAYTRVGVDSGEPHRLVVALQEPKRWTASFKSFADQIERWNRAVEGGRTVTWMEWQCYPPTTESVLAVAVSLVSSNAPFFVNRHPDDFEWGGLHGSEARTLWESEVRMRVEDILSEDEDKRQRDLDRGVSRKIGMSLSSVLDALMRNPKGITPKTLKSPKHLRQALTAVIRRTKSFDGRVW